jgi:hypothetical protein
LATGAFAATLLCLFAAGALSAMAFPTDLTAVLLGGLTTGFVATDALFFVGLATLFAGEPLGLAGAGTGALVAAAFFGAATTFLAVGLTPAFLAGGFATAALTLALTFTVTADAFATSDS